MDRSDSPVATTSPRAAHASFAPSRGCAHAAGRNAKTAKSAVSRSGARASTKKTAAFWPRTKPSKINRQPARLALDRTYIRTVGLKAAAQCPQRRSLARQGGQLAGRSSTPVRRFEMKLNGHKLSRGARLAGPQGWSVPRPISPPATPPGVFLRDAEQEARIDACVSKAERRRLEALIPKLIG